MFCILDAASAAMNSGSEDAFFAEKADGNAAAFARAALRRAKDPSPHSVRLKPDATYRTALPSEREGKPSRAASREVRPS